MAVPYQRHQKRKQLQQQAQTKSLSESNLQILQRKPFWIWNKQQHTQEYLKTNGQCCFNHIVGLPVKDKIEHPIYDYEKILYDSLLGHGQVRNTSVAESTTDFKDK